MYIPSSILGMWLRGMTCLAFSGQSDSLFLTEKDGQSDGYPQAQEGQSTTAFLLG